MKLIVTDLDGTLLRSDKTISPYTKNVILKLKEQGHLFMFATARPVRTVKNVLPKLYEDIACYHNGAFITKDEKLICSYDINQPIQIITQILEKYPNTKISLEADEHITCNFDSRIIWPDVPFTFTKDFRDVNISKATKILIACSSKQEATIYEEFLNDDLYIEMSEQVAMIIHKKASKLNAIQTICHLYHLTLDDVICFGDDYNDIEMVKASHLGIAVNNAIESLKEVANDICLSNDQDGLAHYLNQYFNLGVKDE